MQFKPNFSEKFKIEFIMRIVYTTKQVCFLFSDRGTPVGYRYLNGYGSHTFKMVNAQGEPNYVKFHYKTDQGIKCFDRHQADEMAKQVTGCKDTALSDNMR